MFLRAPKFWHHPDSPLGRLLEPLSWLYRAGAAFHQKTSKPYQADVPVISIGNFVLGGAGKTPLTLAIAKELQTMGCAPHIISRGYGGSLRGPVLVNVDGHSFRQVGDEPLLLAQTAPTWVSKNRQAALNLAVQSGANILLLDDGHQNYAVKKDVSFMAVNAAQGFGNGRVFPAGPLRQKISAGLEQTTAVVFVGEDHDPLPASLSSLHCPLIRATLAPTTLAHTDAKPGNVAAFAGIGHPEKFRQTLIAAGYCVKAFFPFPDHWPYTAEDLRLLKMRAYEEGASLITTEKDAFRLPPACRPSILTLPVRLNFHPPAALSALLKQLLKDCL